MSGPEGIAGLLGLLFVRPMSITGAGRLAMLLPLAASVAVVYKTIRCEHPREIAVSSVVLWATIIAGMLALGVALLIGFQMLL